ncbi:MAG TPA: nucleotidyltransferase domain-containing protein [Solirubrobacterales bacterium]|jgi:predicted nucleotidyltransferase
MTDMLAKCCVAGSASPNAGYDDYDSCVMAAADEILIAEAGRRLAEAAPDARVILFGSYARGEAQPDSDLDLLVIEPKLRSRRDEFVRLRRKLRGLKVPIDLIVVSTDHVEEWGHFEGTMLNEALNEGRVLAGA